MAIMLTMMVVMVMKMINDNDEAEGKFDRDDQFVIMLSW